MFEGFFGRLFYGNPNKPDLKKEDMEEGRIKLFFIVLQVRFWKLIQLNLLLSLFWIPVLFLLFNNVLALNNFTGTQWEMQSMVFMFFILPLIPCLLIAGPATAGATLVVRNWARDQHAWVWLDFKDAFKKNWKESLIIMLINGIALAIWYVNLFFYNAQMDQHIIYVILYYFVIIMGIVFAMMNMFIFPMLVTYKLNIRQIYKNAFIFALVELPRNFIIFILFAGLFFVLLYYSLLILMIPMFLVGFTFPMFISISYTNWVFDKYLNKNINESGELEEEKELS